MTAASPLLAPIAAPDESPGAPWARLRRRAAGAGVAALPVSLWFTETYHAGALIPSVTLAAHTGGGVSAGALLPPQGARGTRVGAIRWQLRSGLVESVEVAAEFYGQEAGRVLAAAARALTGRRSWPALHGDLTERPPVAGPTGVERLVADLVPRLI